MNVIDRECSNDLAVALGKRPEEIPGEVALMAALRLFELGRVSSGLAARLAGMARAEFLLACGRYGVSIFQQTEDELRQDIVHASRR